MASSVNLTNRRVGVYRCVSRIATGGFGTIWKAEHVQSSEAVAIKVLNHDVAQSREAISAFAKEYKLCQGFDHVCLLEYLDFGKVDELPFMVMEYFDSVTLKVAISGACSFKIGGRTDAVLRNAARALDYIHTLGVVHCDVKPENLLVNAEGEIRLIDFSIAQSGLASWLSFSSKVEGTPSYMSPEQIQNKRLTPATDMYAFGATAYELLTGRPPFVGEDQAEILRKHLRNPPPSPCKLNPGISSGLDKLVLQMLAKSPDKRPRDMKAFLRQLERVGVYREY